MIALNIISWLALTTYVLWRMLNHKPVRRLLLVVLCWTLLCWLLDWPSLLFLGHIAGYGVTKVGK